MDRNDGTTDKTSEKQTKVRSISASVKSKDCMVIFLKRKRILVQMEFHMKRKSRRRLLRGITGLIASAGLTGKVATAANPTPGAAEGPFYPEPSMRAPDDDNNLVKISGLVEAAGGEVFTLRGRLTGCDGRPLAEHRIEIWQCDVNGKYQHTADNRSVAYDACSAYPRKGIQRRSGAADHPALYKRPSSQCGRRIVQSFSGLTGRCRVDGICQRRHRH